MHVLFLAPDTHVYNHAFLRGLVSVGAKVSGLGPGPADKVSAVTFRTQLPEVDAVVWRDGALLVEISATSGPARATPAVPSTPVLPVPDSPVVPWSGGMLAAGIGGAALLIAAGLFVRRRRSVKKASGALAGAGRHGEAKPAEPESSTAVDIFYSYSMKDEELRGELTKHLSFLRQKGVLREWHEQKLSPGDSREAEIDRHLETAAVILLLVSSDYAASDTLWNRQMLRALERARRDGTVVIPVLLRPCTWEQAPFAHLQVLPRDRRPVTSWQDRDAALRDVAAGILLVREAGGFVSDIKGGQDMFDSRTIVAGNETIHRAMLKALAKRLKPV